MQTSCRYALMQDLTPESAVTPESDHGSRLYLVLSPVFDPFTFNSFAKTQNERLREANLTGHAAARYKRTRSL